MEENPSKRRPLRRRGAAATALALALVAQGAPIAWASTPDSPGVIAPASTSTYATGTYAVGSSPVGVAFSTDGSKLYVANRGDDTVSVVDTATGATTTIPVGRGPYSVSATPDGSRVLVGTIDAGTISVIDTSTDAVSPISVGGAALSFAYSPDGQTAYAPLEWGGFAIVDLTDDQLVRTIPLTGTPSVVGISLDGATAYVGDENYTGLRLIDLASGSVSTLPTSSSLAGVHVLPGGQVLAVGSRGDAYLVDGGAGAVTDTFAAGSGISQVAVGAHGTRAYLSHWSGDVTVLDIAAERLIGHVSSGRANIGVAVSPDEDAVAAANYDSQTVTLTSSTPIAPSAVPLTSTGQGTDPQVVRTTAGVDDSVVLLDSSGSPTHSVTVDGQGTYDLQPWDDSIRFSPVLGYTGTATAVAYRVSDAYGAHADSTYTPAVTLPAVPPAPPVSSTGTGQNWQAAAVPVPDGGRVTLLDAGGSSARTVEVKGQGLYTLDAASGVVYFAAASGYSGTADPVTYRVTDAYGQSATGTYAATVDLPAPPAAPPVTTSGTGTHTQLATIEVPEGGSAALLDAKGMAASTITVPGQGTYQLVALTRSDSGTAVRFTPVLGFSGTATPVTYRVADAYGQTTTGTYTATVAKPAPTPAKPVTPTVDASTSATTTITAPTGGSVTLLDWSGKPATTVTTGDGSYHLTTSTGKPTVTFTPAEGFKGGTADPVRYLLTDAYGQSDASTVAFRFPQLTAEDLPGAVRVQGRSTHISYHLRFDQKVRSAKVTLVDPSGKVIAAHEVTSKNGATQFTSTIAVSTAKLTGFGGYTWRVTTDGPDTTHTYGVAVRRHSVLHFTPTRDGSAITLDGYLGKYDPDGDTVTPWTGQPIKIQQYVKSQWVTVRTLWADPSTGEFTGTWKHRGNARLRAYTPLGGVIWSATTDPVTR